MMEEAQIRSSVKSMQERQQGAHQRSSTTVQRITREMLNIGAQDAARLHRSTSALYAVEHIV
jgi:hypothetical protein